MVKKYLLTLPTKLHHELVTKAKDNRRSLNAEILTRLEKTIEADKEEA